MLTNLLALQQCDVTHLSSHNNYLRQLNNVCAHRVKHILQFVYDGYEGLHELRYDIPIPATFFTQPHTGTKSFNVPRQSYWRLCGSANNCAHSCLELHHGSLSSAQKQTNCAVLRV